MGEGEKRLWGQAAHAGSSRACRSCLYKVPLPPTATVGVHNPAYPPPNHPQLPHKDSPAPCPFHPNPALSPVQPNLTEAQPRPVQTHSETLLVFWLRSTILSSTQERSYTASNPPTRFDPSYWLRHLRLQLQAPKNDLLHPKWALLSHSTVSHSFSPPRTSLSSLRLPTNIFGAPSRN